MTDLKITKKHHPSGSLSRRILAVSIFLLVIPLFLQSLFLYRQEYTEKLNDVQTELTILGKERAHFVKKVIDLNVKPLYIEKVPLPPNVPDPFILLSKNRETLLIGKQISPTTAEMVRVPVKEIMADIPRALPTHITLIDDKERLQESEDLLQVQEPIAGTNLKLQLTVDKNQIHGLHLRTYYFHFASLLFFVGVLGGTVVYLFTRRIGKPLKDLCRTMERVSEGASHARYTPDRMGFEINQLGLQFNETLDGLLRHAQEAQRERIHRERLAEEFRIGHEIQASLLPQHVPGLPGLDIATGYFASKEVNGDFYDLFHLENGQLLIALGDAAGKGISACLFSLGLRSMIRSVATVETDLSQLVRKVNDLYILDAHESSTFSTLWLGLYDPEKRRLTYCSQGHPPALLRRGADLQELWTGGIALGAQKLDTIPTKHISLQKGDLLLIYSDGVIEAHDPDQQLFGKHRLNELILRKKAETAQQMSDRLIEEIHLFSHGAPQHDDITLIVLRISD